MTPLRDPVPSGQRGESGNDAEAGSDDAAVRFGSGCQRIEVAR
jgi:hypothetical protein